MKPFPTFLIECADRRAMTADRSGCQTHGVAASGALS
jgi:hypothetical protein